MAVGTRMPEDVAIAPASPGTGLRARELPAEEGVSRGGIHRGRDLVPNLDVVTVGIGEEDVGLAGNELTVVSDETAGGSDRGQRPIDVIGPLEPEAEMRDAASISRLVRPALEDQNVPGAGSLSLNESVALEYGDDPEDGLVEPQGASRIGHGQRDVAHPVRRDGRRVTAVGFVRIWRQGLSIES